MSLRSLAIIATALVAIGLTVFVVYFFVSKVKPTDDIGQGTPFPVPGTTPIPPTQMTSDVAIEYQRIFTLYQVRQVAFQKVISSQGMDAQLYDKYLADKELFPNGDVVLDAAFEDLNGDGTNEAVIMPSASSFCGSGGCQLDIYEKNDTGWFLIFSGLTGKTVGILPGRTYAYRDLFLSVHGDEVGYETRLVRFAWDGTKYMEAGEVAKWNGQAFIPTR